MVSVTVPVCGTPLADGGLTGLAAWPDGMYWHASAAAVVVVDVGGTVGVGVTAVVAVVVNTGGGAVGCGFCTGARTEQPLRAITGTANQAMWRSFMKVLSASLNVMVNLTRIYTSTGDDGQTRLADNSVVPKTDPRIAFGGAVDEANCAIGVALTMRPSAAISQALQTIQNDLFDLGAGHTTPASVTRLEAWCDGFNAGLPALRSFVLPGGCPLAAQLHVARATVRRAELAGWRANEETAVDPAALRYLNRLSDLLFILARRANTDEGTTETLWVPALQQNDALG